MAKWQEVVHKAGSAKSLVKESEEVLRSSPSPPLLVLSVPAKMEERTVMMMLVEYRVAYR